MYAQKTTHKLRNPLCIIFTEVTHFGRARSLFSKSGDTIRKSSFCCELFFRLCWYLHHSEQGLRLLGFLRCVRFWFMYMHVYIFVYFWQSSVCCWCSVKRCLYIHHVRQWLRYVCYVFYDTNFDSFVFMLCMARRLQIRFVLMMFNLFINTSRWIVLASNLFCVSSDVAWFVFHFYICSSS